MPRVEPLADDEAWVRVDAVERDREPRMARGWARATPAVRVTAAYVALASAWILGSDSLFAHLFRDPDWLYQVSVFKGLFFVALTGVVLHALVRAQLASVERERNRVQAAHDRLVSSEAALRATLAEKEALLAEVDARGQRSRELEEQLRHAQQLEAVGQLAGGVAHDFNNMLSVILSATDMLAQELAPERPAAELVAEVREAADRCAALTRQILIFSRKHVAQNEVLDIDVQVADASKLLRRLLGANIQLSTSLRSGHAAVLLDPIHLQQLILNLAVNARDAMPNGGTLRIETELIAGPDGRGPRHATLTVSDTGCGMSPEVIARIFEPFFTTKPEGKGTGLGLATVHEVVRQAGGTIKVDSTPGIGSTFRVQLPVTDALSHGAASMAPGDARGGQEHVLLVEDDDALRTTMYDVLRRHGYRVVAVRNAGEALLMAEQTRAAFDVMVADVVLPMMGGAQLAARLRERQPDMRVLLTSGNVEDVDVGAFAVLPKPFSASTLAGRVRAVLDARGRASSPRLEVVSVTA